MIIAMLLYGPIAEARPHHYRHVAVAQPVQFKPFWEWGWWNQGTVAAGKVAHYVGGLVGKPRAWCGWWMRQQVGQDPGPAFNLVASWHRWGRPSGPTPGAVAIWRSNHHVGKVISVNGGQICTISGNSGGRTGVNERCEPASRFAAFRV